MTDKTTVSFIICTYNRADYLRDTLQSLLDTNARPGQFEVLVINNNSTDKTPTVIQTISENFPNFKIKHISESRQGLSYARNRGIGEATAPNIVFLDDDIRATSSLIPTWISFFNDRPNAKAAGGKIHVQFDDPQPRWMSHFLLPLLGHHDLGDTSKEYTKNKYPFGGNMGFRKEIFDHFGLFHTGLGRKGNNLKASEEKEFFRRLRQEENNIYYLPEAFLYHRVNKTRLTQSYIKKQARGLGASMALQMQESEPLVKIREILSELFKIIATVFLCVGYSVALQFSKADVLLKFRRWIWKGYINAGHGKSREN